MTILTEEELVAFKAAALPLMRFMEMKFHPHHVALVTSHDAEFAESVCRVVRED